MKDLLVGSTGFVGGNLGRLHEFNGVCHSNNVADYYGSSPELCVYAGVPSAMFLANDDAKRDLEVVRQARENIRRIAPKKLILISTIAVYANHCHVDEESEINMDSVPAYGSNRLLLERWIRNDWPDAAIIRLPALYGTGLKKNFLYDLHHIIPPMLSYDRYQVLSGISGIVKSSYCVSENGFYKLSEKANRRKLRDFFENNDFNAISFTDSRSRYQFYNLFRLWDDICKVIELDIKRVNLVPPPIGAKEIFSRVTGKTGWENMIDKYFDYDVKSIHAEKFGGRSGYLCSYEEELEDICKFMESWDEMSDETLYQ